VLPLSIGSQDFQTSAKSQVEVLEGEANQESRISRSADYLLLLLQGENVQVKQEQAQQMDDSEEREQGMYKSK
jgi:hypothetical protein